MKTLRLSFSAAFSCTVRVVSQRSKPLTRWCKQNIAWDTEPATMTAAALATAIFTLFSLGPDSWRRRTSTARSFEYIPSKQLKYPILGKGKSSSNITWVVPRRVTIFLHSLKRSFANQVSVFVDIPRSLRILLLRVGWSQNGLPSNNSLNWWLLMTWLNKI